MAADSKGNFTAFRKFLTKISQDLENRNIKDMIFLLYDSDLPRSKLEKIKCGLDLFELLLSENMMSWQLLEDLLALIRRKDLQEEIKRFSKCSQVPSMCLNTSCKPTPLRKLMYEMAEGMSSEMVENIKFCETPLSHSDKILDALDILDYLIKDKPIRSIQEIPEKLKDIPYVVHLYQKHYQGIEQTDGSDASVQYKARFSSLFSSEDVPTFETEYSHTEELNLLEDYEAAIATAGTFGVINTAVYKEKEVSVKSFHKSEDINMNDLKMIVYLRHPFLLSIIRAEFMPRLKLVYCIKAKMNLAKFLKDSERLQEVGSRNNHRIAEQKKRIKILCQISDALSFLHTPVAHIRGPVVHMNVKPHNIFLDAHDNALLGDIDTAVEIEDGATHRSIEGFETEGYTDRYKEDKRKRPSDDVFSLGIGKSF